MFDLYEEPIWIKILISNSSFLMNFMIWLIAAQLSQVVVLYKFKKIPPLWLMVLFALVMTGVNYFGMNIDLWFITPVYLGVAYLSYRFVSDKSIR